MLCYIRNILGPDGTHGVDQGFGFQAFFGYGGSFLERMLQRVFLCLLRRYRSVAFLPSACGRFDCQAFIRREAAVPFRAQLGHAGAILAFLLARPPAQSAFHFGVVDTEAFRFGLDNGGAPREFIRRGTVDSGDPEAVAILFNWVAKL